MPAPIPVILNARAGASEAGGAGQNLAELFGAAGLEARLLAAGPNENIVDVTRRALRERPPMIVAGGGDGTISSVASVLAGTDVALGVLPMGTLNHFARDLGIPAAIDDAVRNLATGHATQIDVGEVNGRIFINNSSLGLYPQLVHHREQQQQRLGRSKWHAFFRAALLVLRRYPLMSVKVRVEGANLQRRTPLVFIGNNSYQMEGLTIGKRESIDAGILSLYMPRRAGRMGLIRIALRALFGRLRAVNDFDSFRATEFWIETRNKRVRVAADGEVVAMDAPLNYRIRALALRVIVPKPAS